MTREEIQVRKTDIQNTLNYYYEKNRPLEKELNELRKIEKNK